MLTGCVQYCGGDLRRLDGYQHASIHSFAAFHPSTNGTRTTRLDWGMLGTSLDQPCLCHQDSLRRTKLIGATAGKH